MTRILPSFIRNVRPGAGWETLPLPALIIDDRDRVVAMNDAAEIWLNISRNSLLGKPLEDDDIQTRLRFLPSLAQSLSRVRHNEETLYQSHLRIEIGDRAGGHQDRRAGLHVGPYGSSRDWISILLVPEEAGMEQQSRAVRSAARSAIGMAEMLAHEIKNPLAGIRGAAQVMGMNASPEDREMAEMIVSETRRIVALLEQVERFGDTSAPNLRPINIHDVLEKTRRSAAVGFAKKITVSTDYDPSLPPAMADPDQLTQVLLNLIKNAAEAQSETEKPVIRLRTFYDHSLRAPPSDAEPAGRPLPLQIEVEDNGSGLPEPIADQVFEPFVSGRENGTGLGLALVSKIITDHGALIRVDSRPGRTIFRISLAKAQGS
ncbi:PAS domain-containing sensor histidine kinase [Paracoccus caeni]|uniref:histidine kinase n=1 Tax=Paracoccus caeni TaxID=657651 RepID=A0A934SG19_9RHOB|nr:ATP-binding protein [Paracoccus caeni]MBK4217212.1 PAS domain-containing sensor histidine kinase [Paracoccus caeni]